MLKYSLKRLIRSLLTLVILITVIFALLRLMPEEGYFSNYEKMSPQQIENGLRELGLKDPLYNFCRETSASLTVIALTIPSHRSLSPRWPFP